MYHNIKNGAVFIADAHENDKRDAFYKFLKKVESGEIATTQLFLMGDMFDLLIGKVEYCVEKYQSYIDLIENIAKKIEVFYFEGNHDFALKSIFKNTKIIPIKLQPTKFILEDGTIVYLSHGDSFGGFSYNTYTKIVRNYGALSLLNLLDKKRGNFIAKAIEKDQFRKKICTTIKNFKEIIAKKIPYYKAEENSFIVEGHYHQNKKFKLNSITYINLSSFACNQSYFIVECSYGKKFALRGCNV